MKSKHTPGPWTAQDDGRSDYMMTIRTSHCGLGVAYCTRDDSRLIAAAPELLAALRDLLNNAVAKQRYIDVLTCADVKNLELPDAALDGPEMAAARAAIAKAEGNA